MTSRLIVLAVVALAAVAAADTFSADAEERVAPPHATRAADDPKPEYSAEGDGTGTRVLRRGREYLTAADIDAAFPAPLAGVPFRVPHLATAPDGTLALAVYKLPRAGRVRAAIELWRDGELVGAFTVPPGSFGGGLGFAGDGQLVATVSRDGLNAVLFTRAGEQMGKIPITSW
jgi:hypothetical protein